MAISLLQHRAAVTQSVIASFSDSKAPNLGLSAFFPTVTYRSKLLSIEVQRNKQLVASDVQRGTESHRNTFNKFSQKIYEPPFFSEVVDLTSLQGYDLAFANGIAPTADTAEILVNSASREVLALKYMIQRAAERYRASVLQTGIVVVKNGDTINYNRKAQSMPVLAGADMWTNTATADPLGVLKSGADFLREEGLSAATMVNAVFGGVAFANFMANAKVQAAAAIFSQIRRVDIGMPQFNNITGMVYQGRVAAGDYIINIWTYADSYENADGSKTKYVDPVNVIMVPDDFEGETSHGGIPTVFNPNTPNEFIAPSEGEFVIHDLVDQRKKTWDIVVESAPLPVPFSVDRIVTIKTS